MADSISFPTHRIVHIPSRDEYAHWADFSEYSPNLYDTLEERGKIDRIIADIRKDERRERVRMVLTVLFAIAVVYGLLVGGLVLA